MKSCDAHSFVTGLSLKANTIGAMYVQIVHISADPSYVRSCWYEGRGGGGGGGGKGSDW
jgi:hypothetical protein